MSARPTTQLVLVAASVALVALGASVGLSRAVAAGAHLVSQKGKAFSVNELHVKVGDTVTFKNDDEVSHNVFSVSKVQPFNTKIQTPGSEAAVTFAAEGTVEVRCAIHPGMKLKVQVEK